MGTGNLPSGFGEEQKRAILKQLAEARMLASKAGGWTDFGRVSKVKFKMKENKPEKIDVTRHNDPEPVILSGSGPAHVSEVKIHANNGEQIIEFRGVFFSLDFFIAVTKLQPGQLFQFVNREDGQMLIRYVNEDEAAQIEAKVLLQQFGAKPIIDS